jgi:hypothetical protein
MDLTSENNLVFYFTKFQVPEVGKRVYKLDTGTDSKLNNALITPQMNSV